MLIQYFCIAFHCIERLISTTAAKAKHSFRFARNRISWHEEIGVL